MTMAMGLPLAAGVVLRLAGAPLGRRLPPATAVRLLTISGLVTALATGFVLAVAAFLAAAVLPRWRRLATGPRRPCAAAACRPRSA
jgi:hypothetical protein